MNNAENTLPSDIKSAHAVINELSLKNQKLLDKNQELQQQNEWFKRQIFGEKSEKVIKDSERLPLEQLWLGIDASKNPPPELPTTTVKEHVRKRGPKQILEDDCGESGLRFDSGIPVEVIPQPPAEIQGLTPDQYEIIETKVTERLCQRIGSYYVKRFLRPVVKIKASSQIVTTSAPASVFEKSYADASLLAGILVDKFLYYLPLYRQHQRMTQAGVMIARANLTNWVHRSATLLEPIYQAVLASVVQSKILAMDETPLKAGPGEKGKLHRGYIWALYGDKNEAAFLYSPTRAMSAIEPLVKNFSGALITDGYTVYEKLCALYPNIEHALCWAHARREFFEALKYEPERCQNALDFIQKLYAVEAEIRDKKLLETKKQQYRVEHSREVVERFFAWLKNEAVNDSLLPKNTFLKAANYALVREQGLKVYLSNPDVPIDTNHLEREIRPLPMGRKNWLFCWTEVGAEAVAIIQTLISCCKLQGIDPFEYLEDVLKRVDSHPISKVHELTPRAHALARAALAADSKNTNESCGNAVG